MKRNFLKLLLLSVIVLVSCSKDDTNLENQSEIIQFPEEPLSVEQINSRITETIENTGDFDWNAVDEHFLWSAVVHGQNVLTVGYGNPDQSFSETEDPVLESKKMH